MQTPTRQEIFRRAADKMRGDFAELMNIPHAGVKGGHAEEIVRKFLNSRMPQRFRAGTGFIIDPQDSVSRQTDVLVYDALNCPVYWESDGVGIFPSTNVAAVVEVKSDLDGAMIESAAENISQTKALRKYRRYSNGEEPVRFQTLGCLFAFNASIGMQKVVEHYAKSIRKHGLGGHIDVIMVLDKAVISLFMKPSHIIEGEIAWAPFLIEDIGDSPDNEGLHISIGIHELGNDSLDGFMRLLLVSLSMFHHRVDHPGFNYDHSSKGRQVALTYFDTLTLETDPALMQERRRQYAEQIRREFASYSIPPSKDQ